MRNLALTLALVATLDCLADGVVWADAAVFRSFDGPELTWQLGDGRPGVGVVSHGCVGDDARQGSGSEHLVVAAPMGDSLHFICPVGRLPVLEEFAARLWVKAKIACSRSRRSSSSRTRRFSVW